MASFGESDDDTHSIEDSDSIGFDTDSETLSVETGSETISLASDSDTLSLDTDDDIDFDTDDDSVSGNVSEHQDTNVEEESTLSSERIAAEGQVGFEPDARSQVSGSSQYNRHGGYPPRTPQALSHSAGNNPSGSGSTSFLGGNFQRATDLFVAVSVSAGANKARVIGLAVAGMEELSKMALRGEPLWRLQQDGKTEVLNDAEYMKEFRCVDITLPEIMRMVEVNHPRRLLSLQGNSSIELQSEFWPLPQPLRPEPLHSEASRATGYVGLNPISLVELLMDLRKWSLVFSNIVSEAVVLGVLASTGVEGNFSGTLQVIRAEFHVPSPLVPVRENYFVRYCKRLSPLTWGVVDVSLEEIFAYPSIKYRRRPSGCLIQEMPNGGSKVIWVEHVEADNRWVHNIFQPLVNSGFAFGANRWVCTIARQCERLATLMSRITPTDAGILIAEDGKRSLIRLSERMMRNFFTDISASAENAWMPFPAPGAEDMRIMTKYFVNEPGKPTGPTVGFATSVWVPASPTVVFDFLRSVNCRNKWDILSYGHRVEELAYIMNGEDRGNRISIMEVTSTTTLYLQESYTDSTGSYVVYAPMDQKVLSAVLSGINPDRVAMLPSGFAILPDRQTLEGQESKGSLLSIGYHIVHGTPDGLVPPESVGTMKHILLRTALSIRMGAASNNLP